MPATIPAHRHPVLKALEGFRPFDPAAAFTRRHPCIGDHDGEAAMSRMSLQIPDESTASPDKRCVTLWSFLEESARLRSGWY